MWTVILRMMKHERLGARSASFGKVIARSGPFGSTCHLPVLVGAAIIGLGVTEMSGEELVFEGNWQLQSVNSEAVVEASGKPMPFFEIVGTAIRGHDGCNRFFGSLDRPGAIKMTRRACSSDTLKLPLDMNDLDAHLRIGSREGDVLTVPARGTYPASTYVLLQTEAEPGVEPSSPPTDQSGLADPHKRADFEAVQERNRAKIIDAKPSPSGAHQGHAPSKSVSE